MAHVDVHERGARKEMVGFGRNDGNAMITTLADMSRSSNTSNAVSDDDDIFLSGQFLEVKGTIPFEVEMSAARSYLSK